MKLLRYTLLSDGSSDRALMPHLTWLLRESGITIPIYEEWAELRHLPQIPRSLSEKLEKSIDLYPCDLLFVHRDAERENPGKRREEVAGAMEKINEKIEKPVSICVIPVKMQEAWLLFNEGAIRRASGNFYGRVSITLPRLREIENLSDPKETLFELLRTASEKTGRKLKQYNVRHSASQVSQFIEDFSPLRHLPAFQTLEKDVKEVIEKQSWK
jgi:hypothetical protein